MPLTWATTIQEIMSRDIPMKTSVKNPTNSATTMALCTLPSQKGTRQADTGWSRWWTPCSKSDTRAWRGSRRQLWTWIDLSWSNSLRRRNAGRNKARNMSSAFLKWVQVGQWNQQILRYTMLCSFGCQSYSENALPLLISCVYVKLHGVPDFVNRVAVWIENFYSHHIDIYQVVFSTCVCWAPPKVFTCFWCIYLQMFMTMNGKDRQQSQETVYPVKLSQSNVGHFHSNHTQSSAGHTRPSSSTLAPATGSRPENMECQVRSQTIQEGSLRMSKFGPSPSSKYSLSCYI